MHRFFSVSFFNLFLKNLKKEIFLVYKSISPVLFFLVGLIYWMLEFSHVKSSLQFFLRALIIFCVGYYLTAVPFWLVVILVLTSQFIPNNIFFSIFFIGFIAKFTL